MHTAHMHSEAGGPPLCGQHPRQPAGGPAQGGQEMEQFEQVIATWKWTSLLFTYVLHDLDVFALARAAVDGGTAG